MVQARGRKSRWVAGSATVSGCAIAFCTMLYLHWPYRYQRVIPQLQAGFSSSIEVQHYRSTYFPHPGFIAEGLVFHRNGKLDIPPLATLQKLTVQGSYVDMLLMSKRLRWLRIEGLHAHLPAPGSEARSEDFARREGADGSLKLFVDSLNADGAVIDIDTQDGSQPLRFQVSRLQLRHLSARDSVGFVADLQIPVPKGEVHVTGSIGPLTSKPPGTMRLEGSYTLLGGDLAQFSSTSGKLFSAGRFEGPLNAVRVNGKVSSPDLKIGNGNPFGVAAVFNAQVDGTSGNTVWKDAQITIGHTQIHSTGSVQGNPKRIDAAFAAVHGRIEDVLNIVVQRRSPLSGSVDLQAKAEVPSGDAPFLKRLRIAGDFAIRNSRFSTEKTQFKTDLLAERARNLKQEQGDHPEPVLSDMGAHVAAANGLARLDSGFFQVPGASAHLEGTFNLLNHQVNLRGQLLTKANVSQATSGILSVLLKPVSPLFRKHGAGASVPIEITGTYRHPKIGTDLMRVLR